MDNMVVNQIFDFLFGWAVSISPLFGITVVSFVLSILSALSWKYLTDQTLLKSVRDKTKALQEEFKKNKSDPKKLSELNTRMAKENFDAMKIQYKQSVKPMIITLIPFALVFIWIRKTYAPIGAVIFGFGGIGTYIILSIIFSMILRKVMKVY